MYWLSHMHGNVPSMRNICWSRWQMCDRPGKVYFMWHMRINLSGWRNRPRRIIPPPNGGIFIDFPFFYINMRGQIYKKEN